MLKHIARSSLKVAALSLIGVNAYSRLAIDHNVPLSPALAAPKRTLATKAAGQIAYYVAEDHADHQNERPLVLIHSVNAAASAIEMKPLFDHYRQQRPVYVLDLPGYGFSNRAPRDYTPQLFADVIVEFLETVVKAPADVIALSLSCEFVARAAVNRAALFHSLVFLSPTGFTAQGNENTTERASRNDRSDRVYRLLSFPIWAQPLYDLIASKASIRYFLQKSFVGAPSPELIEYGYSAAHQPNAKNVPLHFLSGRLFTSNIRHTFYEQLTVPTLMLYDQDPYVDFSDIPRLLTANTHWQAQRIPNTYGLPHWEKLGDVTMNVDRFWEQDERPATNFA